MGLVDPLTLALVAAIALIVAAILFWLGNVRYEVAVLLVLLSSWTHWLFLENNASLELTETPASYLRVGLVLFGGAIGYTTFLRMRRLARERVPVYLKLLFAFILLAIASSLYSIDQQATFTRSIEFLAFFGFLLGLHARARSVEFMDRVILVCAWFLIAGLALNALSIPVLGSAAWNPSLPDRLQAITDNPNFLGALCMFAYPMYIWLFPRMNRGGKAFLLTMFLATIIMHVLTGSKSSMFVSLLEVLVWCVLMRRMRYAALLAGVLALSVAASSLVSIASFKRDEALSGSSDILTGRTAFWKAAAIKIRESPLLGYGFEVSGKVWDDPRFKNEEDALWSGSSRASLHNGYIDMVIGMGLPGLVLWVIILVLPLLGSTAGEDNRLRAILLSVFLPMLVLNFVESAITSSRALGPIIFWIFWTFSGKLRSIRFIDVSLAAPREADAPLQALEPTLAESYEC